MMYVFVEIDIDEQHFIDTVKALVSPEERVACVGTIQFVSALRSAVSLLQPYFTHTVVVPQNKPLSSGELLGCTSPKVNASAVETVIYVGDGRFHLESFMIANPSVKALQYDPYKKVMTVERYDHQEMKMMRKSAIDSARSARSIGLIMGTLGRQGNPRVVDRVCALAIRRGIKVFTFLMSEIFPHKLSTIDDVDCFVQVACPRLSIDWGYAFPRPLLSPYEAEVAFGEHQWSEVYPMDHYSREGGKWAVYTDKSM